MPEDMPTFLPQVGPLSPLAHQYFAALLRGERHVSSRLVLDAVAAGTPVKEIYLHVFQPAQYEIGRLWQTNRISVAQEHYCTAATQLVMSQLYPQVFATTKNGRTLVATCVAGDLHEIGVRMVAEDPALVLIEPCRWPLPAADPALYLPPGRTARVLQETALRFSRSGQPVTIQGMTGFVSEVQFADGKVWVPNRQNLENAQLLKVLPPSNEEQRLSDLYRIKGIGALIEELKKF